MEEFKELQVAVQSLLDAEEKEADHMDWYEPKMIYLERFLEMVGAWMDKEEKEDGSDDDAAAGLGNEADKESVPVGPSVSATAAASDGDGNNDEDEADSEIGPSISEVSGQTTGSSNATKSSKASRLSAACVEADTERAALNVKIQSLEQKHALDMEQAQLKAKQEKLALATKPAAAEARAKLLRQSRSGGRI